MLFAHCKLQSLCQWKLKNVPINAWNPDETLNNCHNSNNNSSNLTKGLNKTSFSPWSECFWAYFLQQGSKFYVFVALPLMRILSATVCWWFMVKDCTPALVKETAFVSSKSLWRLWCDKPQSSSSLPTWPYASACWLHRPEGICCGASANVYAFVQICMSFREAWNSSSPKEPRPAAITTTNKPWTFLFHPV